MSDPVKKLDWYQEQEQEHLELSEEKPRLYMIVNSELEPTDEDLPDFYRGFFPGLWLAFAGVLQAIASFFDLTHEYEEGEENEVRDAWVESQVHRHYWWW